MLTQYRNRERLQDDMRRRYYLRKAGDSLMTRLGALRNPAPANCIHAIHVKRDIMAEYEYVFLVMFVRDLMDPLSSWELVQSIQLRLG
jgi:hypothetical protein